MGDEQVNISCKGCGQVFLAFLTRMAEHNTKVVCPKCGTVHDYDALTKTGKGTINQGTDKR